MMRDYKHYCSKDFILEGRRKPVYEKSMYVIGYLFVSLMITIVIAGVLTVEAML